MAVPYKKIYECVKDCRRALTRRGYRPGHLVLVVGHGDDTIVGTTEDMTLTDARALLRLGLCGVVKDEPSQDQLKHEILVALRAAQLPAQFALVAHDRHTNLHHYVVNESVLPVAAGEALFQVGRLIGGLEYRQRAASATRPEATTTVSTQPPKRHWLKRLTGRP
jgi:hypothetical protein